MTFFPTKALGSEIAMTRWPPIRTSAAASGIAMLLACALLAPGCRALLPDRAITQYIQTSWNSESGLPQNSVHAVTQTANGYLWLGTEEGLTRFDGVVFKNYSHSRSPGLPSDFVRALEAGRDGSLWIGTDSGLAQLKPRGDGSPSESPDAIVAVDGLGGLAVTVLKETADGVLWVGTAQGLFRVVHGRALTWQAPGLHAKLAINALVQDAAGALWVATPQGLFVIRSAHLVRQFTARDGLPADEAISLASSSDGSIWAGFTAGHLAQIVAGRVRIPAVKLPVATLRGLLTDRDGNLWISFDRQGIGRLGRNGLSLYGSGQGLPSDRSTRAIFEDREGTVWFGTLDAGLVQLRDGKFAVFGTREGLSGDYIGNVLQARDGTMWFGADSNGLNHLFPDGRVEVWDHRKGLPNQAVYSILQRRDGTLWVGYKNGQLAEIRGNSVRLFADPAAKDVSLNALFEDRDGQLWLGFWGAGLVRFTGSRFEHLGPPALVAQIAQSPDGALWTANDGDGAQRFRNGAITRFDTSNGLPGNHVLSLYADRAGDMWVGTASGGLSRIRGDQVVSWKGQQGVGGSTIGSIIEDGSGYLWYGTDNGIFQLPKADLDRTAADPRLRLDPEMYGLADGLRTRETLYGSTPCVWKGRDGRLWFVTIRGAGVIDPAHIRLDTLAPTTWIEHVLFDGQEVPSEKGIRLGPGAGNLEISFAAPSFVAAQQVQYRYRLVGFDPEWVEAGRRRTAWYTNLPPGPYRFEVQAQNSDGLWSHSTASLEFRVVSPWYRTPLAFVSGVALVLLAGWGIVALRTRVLVRRQRELARMVAERTDQLQQEKAALEAARRELQIQATHDSLTQIANRGAILEHLDRELARAARDRSPLGVVLLDLDHFKRVNDDHGHLCGDEVLRQSASRLKSNLRGYDLVGRYGGEEFLVLFPGWEVGTGTGRIEDLLNAIGSAPFQTEEGEIQLTCSIGVANFLPQRDPLDAIEILRRADAELYAAKNAGRNRASFELRGGVRARTVPAVDPPAPDEALDWAPAK